MRVGMGTFLAPRKPPLRRHEKPFGFRMADGKDTKRYVQRRKGHDKKRVTKKGAGGAGQS